MATRTERVVLELQSNISTQLAKDAAAVALLKRELSGLDGSTRSASSSTRTLEQDTQRLGQRMDDNGKSIDKLSGRLELFAHAAAGLGPALVPIGAAAIPLLSSIASGIGFTAAGAGVAELAFHGLGDALTKFNKAALSPTAANITAASAAMDKLPPSAQRLVLQLHALSPELDKLRSAAASGFAPGVSDGLHALISDAPLVQSAVKGIGNELGNLARDAGQSLSSERWRPFIRFIGQEAPRELDLLGHSAGNVTHGLGQLWMAFTPLNQGVDSGILRMTREFDAWATSLGRTRDFQSFVAYIQANGPRVTQLLGDVGQTFVDLVQAAAPLGGPTLRALDLVVKALDLIASSPLGTPLLALLQLNSALKLTSSGLGLIGVKADLSLRSKIGGGAKIATGSLLTVSSAADRARMSTQELQVAEEERAAAQRAQLIKGGAAIAGIALASTGAADAMGLQNTTMLATAGLMAGGPWGAAVGGGVGLMMDWNAESKKAAENTDAWKQSVQQLASAGDILGLGKQAQAASSINSAFSGSSMFGSQVASQVQPAITGFDTLSLSINRFKATLTGNSSPVTKLSDLQALATRMQPAMAKLGITFDDMLAMDPVNLARVSDHLARITNAEDTTAGKTNAVANAFAAMGDQSLTTEQKVQGLTDALNALLDPKINVSAATDAVTAGLHSLGSELDKNSKSLKGNSDAALKNRSAIRQRVENIKNAIEAEAQANVAPDKMTASLKRQNAQLIAAGVAAGISRKDMQDYLKTLGLTPKALRTIITLNGLSQAERNLRHLTRDRTIHIHAQLDHLGAFDTTGTGGKVLTGYAAGGTVRGPSGPYGDRVLTMLAPGEEVISNRHGQADQHRDLLKAINARRYADGGTVARSRANVYSSTTNYAGTSIDYSRLAGAMSQARPLYGDVNISGDPTAFKRQMRQDHAMAQMSGVRRG